MGTRKSFPHTSTPNDLTGRHYHRAARTLSLESTFVVVLIDQVAQVKQSCLTRGIRIPIPQDTTRYT